MECAGAAIKTKSCHLKAKYNKLSAQLGSKKKSRMAIAHKLALIVYKIIGENIVYFEPKPKPQTERTKRKILQKSVRDLERLGYKVNLEPVGAVS